MYKRQGERLAARLAGLVQEEGMLPEGSYLIGPAPASIGKLNDIYRFVIYVKSPDYDVLIRVKDRMEQDTKQQEEKGERVQFDFDPMSPF